MRDFNINYDSYKKSSVTFIEYIPTHWSVQRIKDVIHGIDQGWSPNAENRMVTENEWGVLKLSAINNGKYYENKHKALPSYEIPKHQYLVKRGDFLLTRSNTPNLVGECCLVTMEPTLKMMYSDLIYNLKINKRKTLDRYLNYFLSCESFRWLKTVSARGLNDSMVKISQGIIRGWSVCSPPGSEQKNISDYLDNKTKQIDHQIDLLNQKVIQYGNFKQSLINETVVRGLDKTVAMKDSGVEWIGEVPEYWEVKRLKDIACQSKEKNGKNPIGAMLSVSGYRGIEIKQYDDELKMRTEEELSDYRVVRVGQLVVNTMWLNYRGIGVSKFRGYVSPAYRSYNLTNEVFEGYIHYLMRSDLYVAGYSKYLQGIRPNSLQMKTIDFECLPVILPSFNEQQSIADYLDEKTAHIDHIVVTINTQIDKLKELRKTLINDVVTGKIKVPVDEEH